MSTESSATGASDSEAGVGRGELTEPGFDWNDSPIEFRQGVVYLLEQTLLPREEKWLACTRPEHVADAIRRLAVRGAPAIGVSAAYGLTLALQCSGSAGFEAAHELLMSTRPTAVNLRWALEQGRELFESLRGQGLSEEQLVERFREWSGELHRQDIETNRRMGEWGAALFESQDRVLTHCNTGSLATAGYGTALGVIRAVHAAGKLAMVWVDETRPLLQGARLTSWELGRLAIPHRLVTDSSAGTLMAQGLVDRIVVGADRIAANGDVANKIGTYVVAVLAQRHGVPFYVAAPTSTIDPHTPTGKDIPIEQRDSLEVTEVFGQDVAPSETTAVNFAFDVTPNELVSGIITEVGVLEAPYVETIERALQKVSSSSG